MTLSKRSYLLILILAVIVLVVDGLTLSILYKTSFEQQRDRLIAAARSQATLIEAVARFDAKLSQRDHSADAAAATLSQVRDAYRNYEGFGRTGEFVIGKLENNNIIFLSQPRFEDNSEFAQQDKPLPMGSAYAIPMQRALAGKSGAIVAPDYRGEMVLAAHEPLAELKYGVIAKIDLSEVREPFIRAGLISVAGAVVFIAIGSLFFLRITNPMIKRLQDSEAYSRMLFEASPIGLALCRMDGSLVDINPAYANIIGRSIEETKQLTYWDLTPKEYAEEEQQQLERLDTVGRYGPYEKEYIHKQGHRVPVSLLGQIIERNGEKYIWSSVEDISQRKIAEQKLKDAQERLQLLLDSTGEAVYGVDLNGRCTFANPACASILGYDSVEELLGKNIHEVIHHTRPDGSHYPPEKCRINQAHVAGTHVDADDEVFWRKDGTIFPVEYSSYPIYRAGKIIGSVVTFNDITRRKLAEQELRQFKNTLDQTLDCVFMFDADSLRFFYVNEGALQQVGYTREELLALHPYDIKPEFPEARFRKLITPLLSGERASLEFETIHRHKNGRHIPVEIVLQFIAPLGDPARFVAIVRDISERKQAEEALRRASELSERVINESPIGISIYNHTGQCIAGNRSIAEMIGATREQVLAQNYKNLESWKRSGLLDAANRSIRLQQKERHEFSIFTMFDKHAFYDCLFVPFKLRGMQHLLFMLDDISERKATEAALKESEALLEKAQAMASVGHWKLDFNTNAVTGSQVLYDIFELSPDEVNIDNFLEVIHPEDRGFITDLIKRGFELGEGWDIEYRIVTKAGNKKWAHGIGEAVLSEDGKSVELIGAVQDITHRKRTEAELARHRDHLEELVAERTKELKEAHNELVRKERLATLGQLTATVSHELRNPLGAMRPSLYVINKKVGLKDEDLKRAIERVDRNIDRCDHIIDELLDFTRITEIERQDTVIDNWLAKLVKEQATPKGISVELELSLDKLSLPIDPDRMRRALINVIDNACQAMQGEGQPDGNGRNNRLTVITQRTDERIEIKVMDTGPGIPKDVLARIFEPLYSTKAFGVGLGMPTVKQIMEQHGGGIDIDTVEGRGTTVTLWLPRKQSEEAAA